MILLFNFLILIVACLAINYCSNKLGDTIDLLGLKMKLPSSIKGATLNGISSSTPELLTSIIAATMVLGIFSTPDPSAFADVSIGALSGSAIFNILIIPFASLTFISSDKLAKIKIDKKAMIRDISFYLSALIILFGSILLFGKIWFVTGIIMVFTYAAYILVLKKEVKNTKEEFEDIKESYLSLFLKMAIMLIPIGFSVHFCVYSAGIIGGVFNIPRIIMSLIVLAGVTSVPDLILSVRDAKNGELDASISNVIGSNNFDILICLGFVLMITGLTVPVVFSEVAFIFIGLVVSAVFYTIAFYFNFSKVQKLCLLAVPYIGFITYILFNINTL